MTRRQLITGKQGGGGGKMRSKSEAFFLIHPNSMELKVNEGKILRVFGFPSKVHNFSSWIIKHVVDCPYKKKEAKLLRKLHTYMLNKLHKSFQDHLGHCEGRLIFRIKDNPQPTDVKVTCLADFPHVELDPSVITFERLLIGYTSRKQLNIT